MKNRNRLGAAALLALVAIPASAQSIAPALQSAEAQVPSASSPSPRKPKTPWPPDQRRWDIEFHLGIGRGGTSNGGAGALPAAGQAFTTGGGSPSRYVPTWFLGDGASLLNDVLAGYGQPERILPLDGMLTSQAVNHTINDSFGGRVTRTLTPIVAIEFAADGATTLYTTRNTVSAALDGSSDAFVSAFNGLMSAGKGVAFTNPSVSSSWTVSDGDGLEVVATGSLIVGPRRQGRFHPYAAVGGGLAMATGQAIATLAGRYAFRLPSGAQVDETDAVTIHFKGGIGAVLSGGGGLDVYLSRASGVRADLRYLFVQNHIVTAVDSHPTVLASTPADAIWSSLSPGIQFATNPSTGLSSNLSASALDGFQTFKGRGFHTRVNVTFGYFWRF